MTATEERADDNWRKLYKAILDFNQPPSVVTNALQFREDVPALSEGSANALTPPLSGDFDWSVAVPTFDEAPVSQLGIAPANTAAPSPRTKDDDAASDRGEPVTRRLARGLSGL